MAPSVVLLTGAGISRESGLDTFRGGGGIWERVRLEDVAAPEAFARDKARVHAFYNARRRTLLAASVQPNAAHHELARLDANWPGDLLLVTQNIDDLHERAGSRRLVHMHGELLKARCAECDAVIPCREDLDADRRCAACNAVGTLRPHVVWFGEMPLALERVLAALAQCHLFVAIGTSGRRLPGGRFRGRNPEGRRPHHRAQPRALR